MTDLHCAPCLCRRIEIRAPGVQTRDPRHLFRGPMHKERVVQDWGRNQCTAATIRKKKVLIPSPNPHPPKSATQVRGQIEKSIRG